ncbi:DUF2059 domain-containing protein [Xanthobacter dioxanivorans]|uniref:DUF2059 domain-containing protein n=1 Tax=Xanthobacter dioxanivorans TaxID=2528964 RepID=A0A974PK75_9HYPH|nr:DUF2059 domain-containing protein [Xanthobacter dioxanivorans]QRG04893.1 DUF2059 domain-containing protein [Xanthobacter dioxanivorans]
MRVSLPVAFKRATTTRLVLAMALAVAGAPALLSLPASAQQAAPAVKPPSAAQMQLSRELVAVNGEARIFDGVIANVVEQAARRLLQTNPDLAKQLGEVGMQVATDLEKRKAEVVDIFASVYASRFSEAELKDAIAFYRTPTGAKLVQERPAIFQDAMKGVQTWSAQVGNEASERIRAEMKKRGVNL